MGLMETPMHLANRCAISVLSILNIVLLLLPITDHVEQLIVIVDAALTIIFPGRLHYSNCR